MMENEIVIYCEIPDMFQVCSWRVLQQFICILSFLSKLYSYVFPLTGDRWSRVSGDQALCICQTQWCSSDRIWFINLLYAESSFRRTDSGILSYHLNQSLISFTTYLSPINVCFIHFRQLLFRFRIFLSLVEEKRLSNMHKKVSCGVLLLFQQHSLGRRFVLMFQVSCSIPHFLVYLLCCGSPSRVYEFHLQPNNFLSPLIGFGIDSFMLIR